MAAAPAAAVTAAVAADPAAASESDQNTFGPWRCARARASRISIRSFHRLETANSKSASMRARMNKFLFPS